MCHAKHQRAHLIDVTYTTYLISLRHSGVNVGRGGEAADGCDAGGHDGAAANARRRGGAAPGGGSAGGGGRAAVGGGRHVCDGWEGRAAVGGAVGGHGSAAVATQRRAVLFLFC